MLIMALDNSQSVVNNRDSVFYRNEFIRQWKKWVAESGNKYDVKTILAGTSVKYSDDADFREAKTDLGNIFREVKDAYPGRNIGAVVLASDGLFNSGSDPISESEGLKAPVYTIALGDTNQRRDLLIKGVHHNRIVYAGNSFPAVVDIAAFDCDGSRAKLTVTYGGRTVSEKEISLRGRKSFEPVSLTLDPGAPGEQHFILQLSPVKGEASLANNRYDIFVNVINNREKIWIEGLVPHPDLGALAASIGSGENYEVTVSTYGKSADAEDPGKYDLVILHQIPGSKGEGLQLVKQCNEKHVPILFVLGAQSGLSYINNLNKGLNITGKDANMNEVVAEINPQFSLFNLEENEAADIKKFPPLYAPFGNYKINGDVEVLFSQQIGYVKTNFPLLVFTKDEEGRTGFLCGEGFWKWRLNDFNISKQETSNKIMSRVIQLLVSKKDKSRFRITHEKRIDETDAVRFDAELYNESYEPVNSAEVMMNIRNAAGEVFHYVFSKSEKAYSLDAGKMPVGTYTWNAEVTWGGRKETAKGSFVILPARLEFTETAANHQILNELAQARGGKMFYPAQLDELKSLLDESEMSRPVIYNQEQLMSWINIKMILFLLLTFLGIEWFVRRWFGFI